MAFTYNGTTVSQASPLPLGQIASGMGVFSSGGLVGRNYSVAVGVTMADGRVLLDNISIRAVAMVAGTNAVLAFSRSGNLIVPDRTGNGMLTVVILDSLLDYGDTVNTLSITSVKFTSLILPASTGGSDVNNTETTIADISGLTLTHQGEQVSQTAPLLPGEDAAGSITVPGVKAGETYQVNFFITFNNGSSLEGGVEIIAQS
jgi:hypothetical protein